MSRVTLRSPPRAAVCLLHLRCPPLRPSFSISPANPPRSFRSHSTSSSSTTHGHSSSVSASEVSHFTQLASSWWDPHGPSRLLHLMNPLRHDFIQSCLVSTSAASNSVNQHAGTQKHSRKDGHTFLDIGCGGGIFASSAARLPTTHSVTAIDPTSEVIAVANRHKRSDPILSQPGRLTYLNCAIEVLASHLQSASDSELTQDNQRLQLPQFDFVTLFEVIEHIDHPASFLRTCLTHLKPGGWLVGSTIARHPLSYITTKVIAEAPWPIGVVPRGTHDWAKYINPSELKHFFAKENVADFERRRKPETSTVHSVQGAERLEIGDSFGDVKIEGCVYLPLVGWKFVSGSEEYGNYFFGVQKLR